jgi:Ca2+-binding EF-hand superfamily protein
MRRKQPKKSDSLEVRLAHADKEAFMARARHRGQSASSLLRGFIDSYLANTDPSAEKHKTMTRFARRAAAALLAVTAITLYLVMPTSVSASPDLKSLFERLDRDRNGLLSSAEFILEDRAGAQSALAQMDLGKMLPSLFVYHASGGLTGQVSGQVSTRHRLQIVFGDQDSDGNGVVSYGEFEAANLKTLREAFEFMDFDDDAGIEEHELREVVRHLPSPAAATVRPFDEIDSNRNAVISWDEFRA